MTLSKEVERYIIDFLLGEENAGLEEYVYYGNPGVEILSKGIYIVPSDFFEEGIYMKKRSLPVDAINVKNIHVLYGNDRIEKKGEAIILYADVIASTFFLITRYEEYVRRECRDQNGRFIGKESTLYRLGLLQTPIVDYYGRLLRGLLREIGINVKDEKHDFLCVCMTHDIDDPWLIKRDFFPFIKNIVYDLVAFTLNKSRDKHFERLKVAFGMIKDPYDTFDWFIEEDDKLKKKMPNKFKCVYFLMTCKRGKKDYGYIKEKNRTRFLVDKIKKSGADIGIHISYQAGENPKLIQKECKKFEKFMGNRAILSRHHYLMCREPEDMKELIKNGITHDYSCCFADGAGFRLGTCRPVKWIDPQEMKVTELTLHPLFVTESKLMHPQYMNLSYLDAKEYIFEQLEMIRDLSGEVVMLFHNTSVMDNNKYRMKSLYHEIIDYIQEMEK